MKKQVNLNSAEWCDMIFEGKNKAYGAYKLRQTAGKRYLYAFGAMLVIVALVVLIPMAVSEVRAATSKSDGVNEVYTMTEVEVAKDKIIEEVLKPDMPELPKEKFAMMEKFTPPSIVGDAEMRPENEIPDQDKFREDKRIAIGAYTEKNGSFDPDAVRKELENANAIMGTKKEDGKGTDPIKFAEIMPQFPGGTEEMYSYISKNLRYPTMDQEIGTQGRVTVQFVVSKDGVISQVKVLRGISQGCDKEAVKVVQSMPKWIPGRQNGVPVAVYFTLPILFKLQ